MRHLHLDLVGGMAGDMFSAALLDCFPEHQHELPEVISQAGFTDLVSLELLDHNDGVLTGKRFKVTDQAQTDSNHAHRHYAQIKDIIEASGLDPRVKQIALSIFFILAEAEAAIHDKTIEEVAFHEVGAWDSIADVICASYLIHALTITSCSCSPVPLGGGQVSTAHGMLPVPAPATAMILKGFEFTDDGVTGERITPTGAAILKYLNPGAKPSGCLDAQGFGFGTKKMPGISNTLRALLITTTGAALPAWQTETVHQIEFEIDDQSPEQLAHGLDKIQALDQVLDVIQYSAAGKKNRLCHAIRVLAKDDITDVITECFKQTSTLGLRHEQVQRHYLDREHLVLNSGDQEFRVKVAKRPGGDTAKVEMDDLSHTTSIADQLHHRADIDQQVKRRDSE